MKRHRCLLAPYSRQADGEYMPTITDACVAFHGLDGNSGRVGSANVPADYRHVTLANSPARESQAKIYRMLEAYVKTFERQFDADGERIKSLYLYSESPGTGKTTSAVAVLNSWLVAHYLGALKRGRQPLQQPGYFLDVNQWQTDYNEFNRPRVPDSVAEPAAKRYYTEMEKAKKAPFAVLDDIGVRGINGDGFRGDLHSIINYRVTNQLPTVYTSNMPIKYEGKKDPSVREPYDLIDVFGEERLADRIGDMCMTLVFTGTSKRGRR